MEKFKPDDKVYCPTLGTGIYTLDTSLINDKFIVRADESTYCYVNKNGRFFTYDFLPCIFHATKENREKLESLYGMEFEKPPAPPAKPTSREIIQAMLERGDKYVPCWASHLRETPNHSNAWVFIYSVSERFFTDGSGTSWQYATPIDTRTGQPITELPNQ